MASRIALDRYVYEDIYPAFKAATDEKELTANLSRSFLNYLADAERGEALRVLAAAQAQRLIPLVDFSVRAGNAFAGNLLELLSGPRDGANLRRAFRLVYASHVMYHADGAGDAARLIADVADHLLAPDGICIMYHLAITPGTFQEFRARFGSEAGATRDSDTGAVTIDDPPAQISAACARLRLPLYEKAFITRLRFGALGDDDWQAFKEPRTYDALAASKPSAYEDLQRLYFIVQRAPLEFAADHSATGLAVFIDAVREIIEANHGVLPLAERMQVFSHAEAPAILRETLPAALAAATTSASA